MILGSLRICILMLWLVLAPMFIALPSSTSAHHSNWHCKSIGVRRLHSKGSLAAPCEPIRPPTPCPKGCK